MTGCPARYSGEKSMTAGGAPSMQGRAANRFVRAQGKAAAPAVAKTVNIQVLSPLGPELFGPVAHEAVRGNLVALKAGIRWPCGTQG